MVESIIVFVGNLLLPYLVLSLLAMLIVELAAAVAQLRGRTLRAYVQRMLGDPRGTGITRDFYDHHLIASLSLGGRLPPYIPSRLFAIAVADVTGEDAGSGAPAASLEAAPAPERPRRLRAILRRPRPVHDLHGIERWYVEVMDGASGAYRLRTLSMLMIVASVMVGAANFDAIRISNHVARRDLVEKAVALQLEAAMKADTAGARAPAAPAALSGFESLRAVEFPIGWQDELTALRTREGAGGGPSFSWLVMKAAGLLISVLAIMIGAPFLFDLLNRFMIVRSTVKPWDGLPDPEPPAPPVAVVAAAPAPPRARPE